MYLKDCGAKIYKNLNIAINIGKKLQLAQLAVGYIVVEPSRETIILALMRS